VTECDVISCCRVNDGFGLIVRPDSSDQAKVQAEEYEIVIEEA